ILDHQVDARDVHVHDPPRTNVEMPYFTVPHLSFRQPDERAARVNQRVGVITQQPIVGWLARQCDRVGFRLGAVTPSVENDQNEWLGTHCELLLLAFTCSRERRPFFPAAPWPSPALAP